MKNEVKVGIFLFIGILSLILLTFQINAIKEFSEDGYNIYAFVPDASGVNKKAKVKLRGVDIGYVKEMILTQNGVKLQLAIKKGVFIPLKSKVTLAQNNLLGGKYIKIIPSTLRVYYKPNETINEFVKVATVDDVLTNINSAVDELKVLVNKVNYVLDKKTTNNIKEAVANIKDSSNLLKNILKSVNNNVNPLIDKFNLLVGNYNDVALKVNKYIPIFANKTTKVLDKFSKTGDTLNQKLTPLMDESLNVVKNANKLLIKNQKPLKEAIKSATDFFSSGGNSFKKLDSYLSSLTKSQLYVDIQNNYLFKHQNFKTDIAVSYLPTPTKYYIIGATSRKVNNKDKLYISAEYGKRYNNLLLRGGIIQSTGGVGIDYYLNRDRFIISSSIYDFNNVNSGGKNPHVDINFIYRYLKHIEIIAGIDNSLNKDISFMLGVGVTFKDNDLKPFLGGASSFLK
jgi:phospholipid/cholesterol/gamma-HCH transport system substrate-binding protein